MSNERVQFRAPSDLIENLEELAHTEEISHSEAWRTAARDGLRVLADDLTHVKWAEEIEGIKREEYPNKRAAWFKANVGGRLLTCFNTGLAPDAARKDLNGYLREARELHDSDEFEEYVTSGLAVYADAYERRRSAMLADWVKSRNGGQLPDDVPESDAADGTAATTDDVAEATENRPYREKVADAANFVRVAQENGGGFDVKETSVPEGVGAEAWYEDVRRMVDADDPEDVDLRGDTDE